MAVQETFTNAIASLLGSTAGVLAALVAVAIFWIGADYVSSTLDLHLPLRQLMLGRTWNTLAVHARFAYAIIVGYVATPGPCRRLATN